MNIGSISDAHVDYNSQSTRINCRSEFVNAMRRGVVDHDLDVLVVAGDISGDVQLSIDVVDELDSFVRTLWIPGNHELWSSDSDRAFARAANHEPCLIDKLVEIDGVQFVGTTGWYNYKFAKAPAGICRSQRNKLWGDRHCNWTLGDVELHDWMLHCLAGTLAERDRAKPVVVATHVVPFREAMTYCGPSSDITDGYIGSPELGELLVREQVDLSLFGHTHIKSSATVNGVNYVCSPVGYTFEWGKLSGQKPFYESLVVTKIGGGLL